MWKTRHKIVLSVHDIRIFCTRCTCHVMQASRVLYSFSHHPDKLRALEMMEPVPIRAHCLFSATCYSANCATSLTFVCLFFYVTLVDGDHVVQQKVEVTT